MHSQVTVSCAEHPFYEKAKDYQNKLSKNYLNCRVHWDMAALNKRTRLLLLLYLRSSRRGKEQRRKFESGKIFQSEKIKGKYHSVVTKTRLGDHESI